MHKPFIVGVNKRSWDATVNISIKLAFQSEWSQLLCIQPLVSPTMVSRRHGRGFCTQPQTCHTAGVVWRFQPPQLVHMAKIPTQEVDPILAECWCPSLWEQDLGFVLYVSWLEEIWRMMYRVFHIEVLVWRSQCPGPAGSHSRDGKQTWRTSGLLLVSAGRVR